jgi:cysteinyl-tRNA synthetase
VGRIRTKANPSLLSVQSAINSRMERFETSISDDLNTSVGISLLEGVIEANMGETEVLAMLTRMDSVLGLEILDLTRADLRIRPSASSITEPEIEALLAQRKEARAAKNFATSDRIRGDLVAAGVEVMDGDPLGWGWRIEL